MIAIFQLKARGRLAALANAITETHDTHCLGLFWWESMAEGSIAKRSFFDEQHNALEVINAFDTPAAH